MSIKSGNGWRIGAAFTLVLAAGWFLSKQAFHQGPIEKEKPSTNATVSNSKTLREPSLPKRMDPLLSLTTTNANPTVKPSERLKYRLTNTPEKLAQLLRNDRAILLENALIDTARGNGLGIPEQLRATETPGSYIVQSRGPISPAFRSALTDAGAEIISYIPNNAYLVRIKGSGMERVTASTLVQAAIPYEPYFKLDRQLIELAVEKKALPADMLLKVTVFPGDQQDALQAITELKGKTMGTEPSPFKGEILTVDAPRENWVELARLPQVQLMEPHRNRAMMNDLSRVRLGVAPDTLATTTNYLGLTGSNVLVSVNDSGVDATHPDLIGRILGTSIDLDGHGTHVAGIIASSGTNSPPGTNVSGSIEGASFRGMAPSSKIFVQPLDPLVGPAVSDSTLQQTAARTNAFISNNSWGYVGSDTYDSAAASWDSAVRDALPRTTGSQPLLLVFAAGNSGGGNDTGLNAFSGTISSPATAKNVITVGAVENLRNITNEYVTTTIEGTNVITVTNVPFLGLTDSAAEVASFSSRGNVGAGLEGDFGRFKPDVMAPGTFVVSTRSTNWIDPTTPVSVTFNNIQGQIIQPGTTNVYPVTVPAGGIRLIVRVGPNTKSPDPLPFLPILIGQSQILTPANFRGSGVAIANVTPGTWYFGVGNPGTQPVDVDLQSVLIITNSAGGYLTTLKELNDNLAPFYRYESGTSMAAPAVAGTLALMQEFFEQRLQRTNSPALMKALLINGARSVSSIYDFPVASLSANHQGWGLANLPNSIPAALAATNESAWPLRFYDQSPTNALATGQSQTRIVTLTPQAQNFGLRVSLVWTDPPGNPAASVKLVNDLDLVVTNLESGEVFVGNFFPSGENYTAAAADATSDISSDIVNNVENVFLNANFFPLGASNSVTVRAKRVNVNAVSNQRDGIVQDYALVISSENLSLVSPFTITEPVAVDSNLTTKVTPLTNGVPLLNLRVGANSPLSGNTNGVATQWRFFTLTNDAFTGGSNVAVATFFPPNLSRPRYATANFGSSEADIDLYVTTDPSLTNLNPATIDAALKSRGRLGTETVVLTNAPKNGEIYYIGVKSEDQQAGEFGIFAIATDTSFEELDDQGNIILNGVPVAGVVIPDGSPEKPQAGLYFAISTRPDQVRRAIVTNQISHELIGDLVGVLAHNQRPVTLNSHTSMGTNFTQLYVYDDSGANDIVGARTSDGPGSLQDYLGEPASGLWLLTQVDNAAGHTGRIDRLTLKIEPKSTNEFTDATISAFSFFYDFFDLPTAVTNVTIEVSSFDGPVEVYLRRGVLPTRELYDKTAVIYQPSGTLSLSIDDSPPLNPGRYFVGFYNPNSTTISIRYKVRFDYDLAALGAKGFGPTNLTMLGDDVLNVSTLTITNNERIVDLEVGVHIEHPRVSDLTLHLVSPQGTRILLAENRGGLTGTNYGAYSTPIVTTNFGTMVLSNGFENANSSLLYSFGQSFSGWIVDRSDVEVIKNGDFGQTADTGTNCVDLNGGSSGMISRNVTLVAGQRYQLSFAYTRNPDSIAATVVPQASVRVGGSTLATLIANQTNSWASLSWQRTSIVFQASVAVNLLQLESLNSGLSGVLVDSFVLQQLDVVTNLPNSYAIFTENTNRSPSLIKFASPPFGLPTTVLDTTLFTSGFDTVAATGFVTGQAVDGWNVVSNGVEVVDSVALANQGTKFLALSSGAIQRSVPTIAGLNYEFKYAYRNRGNVGWWPAQSNTVDVVGGSIGTLIGDTRYTNGVVGSAFYFDGNADSVLYPASPALNVGTGSGFTIEGWIKPDITNKAQPIVEWNSGSGPGVAPIGVHLWVSVFSLAGDLYANLRDSTGADHQIATPTGAILPGVSQHVALTYDRVTGISRLFVNGVALTTANLGNFVPQTSFPLYFGYRPAGTIIGASFQGMEDEFGIHNQALTATEIAAIYAAGSSGKSPISLLPIAELERDQILVTNLVATGLWQTNIISFTANSSQTDLRFEGLPLGLSLDSIELIEKAHTNDSIYYLPEESLKAFIGENALGDWKLEIRDTRAGAVGLAELVDWKLFFTFTRVNPVATLVTNGVSFTNTIEGASLSYFAVDVPGLAGYATNSLLSLTAGNVDLIFNQNALPTGLRATDIPLLTGVATGTSTLVTNGGPPALRPGQRYYLAVRNSNPAETNTFVLRVDFDRVGTTVINVPTLVNGVLLSTNIVATNALQYFQFDVSTNATSAAFEIFRNSGNVNLVISQGTPPPTVASFDYYGFNPSTSNELVVVLTNSSPVNLSAGRWYLGVFNLESVPVTYSIRATEGVEFAVTNVVDLTIDVPTNAIAGPGAFLTNFYRVVIDQTNSAALFEIFGLAGDVDLYARRGALPTVGLFDYRSRRSGVFPEQIVVQTNSLLTDLNGEWFIGVPNSEVTNVSFSIGATVATNGFLITQQPIQFTNVLANGVALNFTVGPGVLYTNVFRFTIDQTNSAALFELYGLSGNVDLLLSRGGIPSTTLNLSSLNPGTDPETIVINTNLLPVTDINGDWFLAVPNNEAFDVNFTIRAVVSTNITGGDILFSGQPLRFTSPPALTPGGNMQFAWNTLPGENYQVQTSTDLVTWTTIATITATTTNTVFTDPVPATGMLFYRINQVP